MAHFALKCGEKGFEPKGAFMFSRLMVQLWRAEMRRVCGNFDILIGCTIQWGETCYLVPCDFLKIILHIHKEYKWVYSQTTNVMEPSEGLDLGTQG